MTWKLYDKATGKEIREGDEITGVELKLTATVEFIFPPMGPNRPGHVGVAELVGMYPISDFNAEFRWEGSGEPAYSHPQ